ncbi:MAG: peptidylprolyl isomerase [Candidatus Methylomirabilia bacterium]
MKRALLTLPTLLVALSVAQAQAQERAATPAIETGSTVELEYTLKDETGKVLETSQGRESLIYTHGQRQIIPGLETALNGMRAGEEKQVTVRPEDGYGFVNPAAVAEVPKETLPPRALRVGTVLVAKSPDGTTRLVRVKEIREKTVILDVNHPLAGKTLYFQIKVLNVKPSKPQE